MIGYLTGQLLKTSPERVLLDVQGVGYEVHIPLSTYYEIERRAGERVSLHVHTHLREDDISLFGFWTEREKQLFERLLGGSGIGRKTAERMVLELKDKMRELAAELPERALPGDGDVVSALVNLGYKAGQAERAVAEARRDRPDGAFHELLRASLNRLSRA